MFERSVFLQSEHIMSVNLQTEQRTIEDEVTALIKSRISLSKFRFFHRPQKQL